MYDFKDCPCGSGIEYATCCQEILAGTKFAQTPLELMRSRYTAHICKNMPHIIRTMRGKALKLFDEHTTREEWFEQCEWTRLEIIDAPEPSKHSKEGIVEFKAHYSFNGNEHVLHERSKFQKIGDQWFYIAGQIKNPVIETSSKIGRNDECSCGSGKKYKRCCGATN